jgi:hypothetical protein
VGKIIKNQPFLAAGIPTQAIEEKRKVKFLLAFAQQTLVPFVV